MTTAIITLIVLILINAFFAASELAMVNLNDNKVKRLADNGDSKAKKLHNLISKPSLFLSTIQIGITLAGFLSSAFAADFFAEPLAQKLYEMGVPLSLEILHTISVVAITVILSYFTLVFGELVPKQLALKRAEQIANFAAAPISLIAKITLPVVKILTFSSNTVIRLFGIDPNEQSEEATEEDIRMMVDIGRERGTINTVEKVMINNIFEFNDKIASDIITHRTDMCVLSIDADLEEVLEMVSKEGYTRFPVYEKVRDNIVGVLHSKDLFQFIGKDENFDLRNVIRKPYFVLESQTIDVLFTTMQTNNVHIAIVLDEFGGTEGMITIEDVIEEIVGEIYSESIEEGIYEEEIKQISPNQYEVKGIARLWELEDVLKVHFSTEELDTLSGFLIHELGYFPDEQERPVIEYKHLQFEVLEIKDNRVEKAMVTVKTDDSSKEEKKSDQ